MACHEVCKQGRDDIIVKVNLQSLIPASFSHYFATVITASAPSLHRESTDSLIVNTLVAHYGCCIHMFHVRAISTLLRVYHNCVLSNQLLEWSVCVLVQLWLCIISLLSLPVSVWLAIQAHTKGYCSKPDQMPQLWHCYHRLVSY